MLIRMEALEYSDRSRIKILRALTTTDQAAFDKAFKFLLSARTKTLKEDDAGDELIVETQSKIYVEGLAILRLADMRGFTTETKYKYCPAIARLPMVEPFPEETYSEEDDPEEDDTE